MTYIYWAYGVGAVACFVWFAYLIARRHGQQWWLSHFFAAVFCAALWPISLLFIAGLWLGREVTY